MLPTGGKFNLYPRYVVEKIVGGKDERIVYALPVSATSLSA